MTCKNKENTAISKYAIVLQLYRSLLAKVKVSSHILFPETLNLSQYGCQANKETFKFHLTGVIIHRGPTAYSGHYIAHILDKGVRCVSCGALLTWRVDVCSFQTGEWYRFDDEHVSKLDKKYLGEEEDEAMLGQNSTDHEWILYFLLHIYVVLL